LVLKSHMASLCQTQAVLQPWCQHGNFGAVITLRVSGSHTDLKAKARPQADQNPLLSPKATLRRLQQKAARRLQWELDTCVFIAQISRANKLLGGKSTALPLGTNSNEIPQLSFFFFFLFFPFPKLMLAGFPPGPFQPALICEINTESGNADAGSESGSAKAVLLFLGAAGKRRNLLEETCPDLPCCPEGLCRLLVLDLSPRRSVVPLGRA